MTTTGSVEVSERPKAAVEKELLRLWNREARPEELRGHLLALLEATGFALVPLMKRALLPALRPSMAWLRLLWPFRRRR